MESSREAAINNESLIFNMIGSVYVIG